MFEILSMFVRFTSCISSLCDLIIALTSVNERLDKLPEIFHPELNVISNLKSNAKCCILISFCSMNEHVTAKYFLKFANQCLKDNSSTKKTRKKNVLD